MLPTLPGNSKLSAFSQQVIFCLNLAFGLAMGTTRILERKSELTLMATGVHDRFRQVLLKLGVFFYGGPVLAPLAIDVVLTALTIAFFVLLALTLKAIPRSDAAAPAWNLVAGLSALAAVPLSWLFFEPTFTGAVVLALYCSLVGGALFLTRHRASPTWFVVLILHYGLCGYAILGASTPGQFGWPRYSLDLPSMWPYLLSVVSPCAGVVWASSAARVPWIPSLRAKGA